MFTPGRGGRAPGHLRDALYEWLETVDLETATLGDTVLVGWEETPRTVGWLLGQLWDCTDAVPSTIRDHTVDQLELLGTVDYEEAKLLRAGCSCGQLVRHLKAALEPTP